MKNGDKIDFIAKYLKVLGIVQLIGLNIGGLFWLMWSSGIKEKRKSSRKWVLGVHSVYLLLAGIALYRFIVDPETSRELNVFGNPIEISSALGYTLLGLIIVVYSIPMLLLCRSSISQVFRDEGI
jgi:hypothetical protein